MSVIDVVLTWDQAAAIVALIQIWDRDNRNNITKVAVDLRRARIAITEATDHLRQVPIEPTQPIREIG